MHLHDKMGVCFGTFDVTQDPTRPGTINSYSLIVLVYKHTLHLFKDEVPTNNIQVLSKLFNSNPTGKSF
jgi:hypothetical protein